MRVTSMLWAMPHLTAALFLTACSTNDPDAVIDSASSAITTANVAVVDTGRLAGTIHSDATITLRPTASGCSNSPGPFITIGAELKLSDMSAAVILRNNIKGTHETEPKEVAASVSLFPADPIKLAKNPNPRGEIVDGTKVGGNPRIWFQLDNGPRVDLGRCTRMKTSATISASVLSQLDMSIDTGNCSGAGGPNVNITGALAVGGASGRLQFFRNPNADPAAEVPDVELRFVLQPPQAGLSFSKRASANGAGGNPLVFVAVPPSDPPLLLGRCNQL